MRDYPGEPLSEETLTHLTYHDIYHYHQHSFINFLCLLRSVVSSLFNADLANLLFPYNFASFAVPLFTDFNAVVCAKKSDKLGFMLKDYRSFKVNRV